MIQRECAGFNWPPSTIPASEPVSTSPSAVSRAGPQIAAHCTRSCGEPLRSISRSVPSRDLTFFSPSAERAVGQPASCTAIPSIRPKPLFPCLALHSARRNSQVVSERFITAASGVGHPEQALSDVRSADARSAQICCPNGVTRTFQVSRYKIPPAQGSRARNLLPKDDCRAALLDEVEPRRPEMPLVSKSRSAACLAERLARARSRPDRTLTPAGEIEGKGPPPDAGEEVASSIPGKIGWSNVEDTPLINLPLRNNPLRDERPQPCGRAWVVLVVVVAHHLSRNHHATSAATAATPIIAAEYANNTQNSSIAVIRTSISVSAE